MEFQLHNYATRPALLRNAIDAQREWIEAKIGVPLSDAVIVETGLNLAQIGVEKVLGLEPESTSTPRSIRRLRMLVATAETPVDLPPLLAFSKAAPSLDLYAALMGGGRARTNPSRIEWQDCPVVLSIFTVPSPVVALNIYFHAGPHSTSENETNVLIARRDAVEPVICLLETLDSRETAPKLIVYGGQPQRIIRCEWDDLVLDPSVRSLLKSDFESFWEREKWFHDRRLPFRRGYLLHGPPGNGKSTAIRAMMSSRGLSAFTIRLFGPQTCDAALEGLFDDALTERPAMVLFEDLDRAFPRTGESRCGVSLQGLLNCLDGVATGEGLVVVATANDPAALDPAILRRPGRFDRVVRFPNPDPQLRERYFLHMKLHIEANHLAEAVADSGGFSFAQLREATILAAQFAFERKDDVRPADLLRGIRVLRETTNRGSARTNAAGFVPAGEEGEAA